MNVNELYDRLDKIKRMILVLRLYVKAEKPTVNRGKLAIMRTLSTIGGSLAGVRSVLREAANGIKKFIVVRNFGVAYRADMKKTLTNLKGKTVTEKDWKAWDDAIETACARLAAVIDTQHHCIPAPKAIEAGTAELQSN